jgi:putative transposase
MIAFIDEHRAVHGVEPICKVLPIAPSTYHSHAARRTDLSKAPARWRSDADVSVAIRRIWDENFQVYGVRKVWRQLQREGIDVARCTVAYFVGIRPLVSGESAPLFRSKPPCRFGDSAHTWE